MRKLTESTPAKITAVIASYIMVFIFVISALSVFVMGYYKFYFSNEETVKNEIMSDMAMDEAYHLASMLYGDRNLEAYYSDKNIFYEVTDIRTDKITETNYSGQEYMVSVDYPIYEWIDKSRFDSVSGEVIYYSEEEEIYNIKLYVAKNMTKNDLFSVTLKIIEWGFKFEYIVVLLMIISLLFAVFLICYLFCSAGHRYGGIISRSFLDRIPFDICTAFVAVAASLSLFTIGELSDYSAVFIIAVFLIGTADYFIGLFYLLSFATRIKTKTLVKNNVIYYIIGFIGKYLKAFFNWLRYIFSNLNLVYKTIAVLTGLIVIEFITVVICFNAFYYFEPDIFIVGLIIINIIFILFSLYLSIVMQRIKQGGEKIAGGELEHKIDTSYMIGDFKSFSESLNNINDGLQSAVNERMKSERFKTELITNVSHDIKTPLTSIVNYVDLIKKENCDNEKINEYIEVLDRHSSRLKKLVEDLVEASKASTGNLSVNLMPCDVGVLLNQTVGEFEDRLNNAGVSPIINIPDIPVKILADGRHLWRVFDNLMNNVCKYALSGTRVYLDVENKASFAVITFRNISRYGLNISADELMERFVRGDSSRNTEGSGLGLSIAKSLVELQNGSMELNVDGDLFKVTLRFPIN